MSRFSEGRKDQALVEAGYVAAVQGMPCEAPTKDSAVRELWEKGWRAGRLFFEGASIEVASVEAV